MKILVGIPSKDDGAKSKNREFKLLLHDTIICTHIINHAVITAGRLHH